MIMIKKYRKKPISAIQGSYYQIGGNSQGAQDGIWDLESWIWETQDKLQICYQKAHPLSTENAQIWAFSVLF